ncbi:MAG: tRNA pseudouridine(55) synthase TruB [Candidatus Omnitrophota bacterium]
MDGILIINKPKGITSHDVVDYIRNRFKIKKVGHAGTLDPMATGVIVVLLGKATKKSAQFLNDDKEYIATLFLGRSTDTQDSTGKVLIEKKVTALREDFIKKTFDSFLGEREQVPPMVSAKKYKGTKLYKLARRGETVSRKPCRINIYEIEILNCNLPEIDFRVKCSKGTYVRTLCEDMGKALRYPAHMSNLSRTRSGRFSLDKAHLLEEIDERHIQPA